MCRHVVLKTGEGRTELIRFRRLLFAFILLAIALFLPLLMRMLWTVDWATIVAVSSLHACMCRLSLPLIPNGDVE